MFAKRHYDEDNRPDARYIVPRQAHVATFCGVSVDTVKNWAKQGMPGHPPRYDLSAIVQWLRRSGPWSPRIQVQDDDALLAAGGDSPALEKLRAAKAAIAELDLQERRCSLVSVETCKEAGLRWATLIKRMGERLAKRFGRDAADTVNATLEECERVLAEQIGQPAAADAENDERADARHGQQSRPCHAGETGSADDGPNAELVARKRKASRGKADKPVGGGRGRHPKRTPRGRKVSARQAPRKPPLVRGD